MVSCLLCAFVAFLHSEALYFSLTLSAPVTVLNKQARCLFMALEFDGS